MPTDFEAFAKGNGRKRRGKKHLKCYRSCSMLLSLERDRQEELVKQAVDPNTDKDLPSVI